MTQAPVLNLFEPGKNITLTVDASSTCLGAALLQDGGPVEYAAKALTGTQINYAQIKKELQAIVFGCERFHSYIYGREVTVETDHKPLNGVFNKQNSHGFTTNSRNDAEVTEVRLQAGLQARKRTVHCRYAESHMSARTTIQTRRARRRR